MKLLINKMIQNKDFLSRKYKKNINSEIEKKKPEELKENAQNEIIKPTIKDVNSWKDLSKYLKESQSHIKSKFASGRGKDSKENFIKIQQALKTKIKNLIS